MLTELLKRVTHVIGVLVLLVGLLANTAIAAKGRLIR